MSDRFEELRQAIDEADRQLVDLVNRRLDLVRELWLLKQERGLDHVDAGREQAIRAALAAANRGSLTAEGLDELVTEVLALTKREMRRGTS